MADDLCEVIITADDEGWLLAFTRRLVENRLAACGQHTPVRSVYTWDGSVQDEQETRVALHTRAGHVDAIIAAANAEQPYEVPCVLAVPVIGVNPGYRAWVLEATEPPRS